MQMNCASFCDKLKPLPLSWRPVSASNVSGWMCVCVVSALHDTCTCFLRGRFCCTLHPFFIYQRIVQARHATTDCPLPCGVLSPSTIVRAFVRGLVLSVRSTTTSNCCARITFETAFIGWCGVRNKKGLEHLH